jgi:hypothetical protein
MFESLKTVLAAWTLRDCFSERIGETRMGRMVWQLVVVLSMWMELRNGDLWDVDALGRTRVYTTVNQKTYELLVDSRIRQSYSHRTSS